MRNILLGVIIIIAIISVAMAGSFASFSDTEESVGNSLETGIWELADLANNNTNETFVMGGTQTFGENGNTQTWNLPASGGGGGGGGGAGPILRLLMGNFGTTPAAGKFSIICVNESSDPDGEPSDVDTALIVNEMTYGDLDLLALLIDTNRDGKISLEELEQQGLYGLEIPGDLNSPINIRMALEYDPGAIGYDGHKAKMTLKVIHE